VNRITTAMKYRGSKK